MKKLLLGSLLIIGATAFGAVSVELKEDPLVPYEGEKLYSGVGSLGLTSRGEIVDSTGKLTLIITPTVNAGADGTSLSFDHGQIPAGTSSELTGKFEAKVVTGKDNKIVNIPEGGKTLSVKLFAENGQNTDETHQGSYSKAPINLQGAEGSKLSYQLTNDSTVQGNIYRGTVLSKVEAGTKPGTFLDRSAKIEVIVNNLQAKPEE